jgi:cell wall-associated NlpC family hydrolase
MRKLVLLFLLCVFISYLAQPAVAAMNGKDVPEYTSFWDRLQTTIENYLHRPYVWGASGLKSFDCSGFVWRALNDSGVRIKRTTARKYYMSLPPIEKNQEYRPGNIVFFDNLKHCGIVSNDRKFYHARSSMGTTLDSFDSYWNRKVFGFRTIPVPNTLRQ